MESFVPIEFHRSRDFSKKINATFEFLKQNFRPLTKSVLFIAGPPVLMGSLLLGSFIGDFFNLSQSAYTGETEAFENYFSSVNFWMQIAFGGLFMLISGVASISSINNYIILYGEKKSNKIEVHEVWEKVKQTFFMYLGTMIFFVILFMAVYIILILPVFLLGAISPFLVGFGVIGVFVGIFYFVFGASLTFFIRNYEKTGFVSAIRRSFYLVRGKWWSTFGLVMILSLVVSTLSYLFLIPWYVVMIANTLHNTSTDVLQEPSFNWKAITILFFTLYYLAQLVLYSIPNIGIALQYFNLVELKEAKGLMDDIQSFGESDNSTGSREEHY